MGSATADQGGKVSYLSIVLVEDSEQQQEAQAAGADVVLLKGYPAAKLMAAIEGCCPESVWSVQISREKARTTRGGFQDVQG